MSRRRALQLGGLSLAGTALGGIGLSRTVTGRSVTDRPDAAAAELIEPNELSSSGGMLRIRLTAAEGPRRIAGRDATTLGYNGGLPGPTLRLQPGDRLRVRLANRLGAPTNLHLHGLHVSPLANGDNPFLRVDPGESFDYDYQLPEDHPPGVYWYHPHHHGTVADQIFGGLYGAILVADRAPIPTARERVLVISDLSLDGAGHIRAPSMAARMMGREGELLLVNGLLRPLLTARPGERERWRIINACTARYLRLRLDGQQLQLLGVDSGRFWPPRGVTEILLTPGNRADLLLTTREGSSALRTLPYDRGRIMGMGMMGDSGQGAAGMTPGMDPSAPGSGAALVALTVSGAAVPAPPSLPVQPAPRDLRGAAGVGRRTLTFGMGMGGGGMRFTIDGKGFDPQRVDQTVQVGSVEEWTLRNISPMDHPLHLHIWPMQIIQQDGQPVAFPAWQDVVNVPAHGEVKVRIAFDDFRGRTVYHCHILDHEDSGMMGVIEAG